MDVVVRVGLRQFTKTARAGFSTETPALARPPGNTPWRLSSLSAFGSKTGKCGQEIVRELAGVCRAGCPPS